jgi:hypothetical protein
LRTQIDIEDTCVKQIELTAKSVFVEAARFYEVTLLKFNPNHFCAIAQQVSFNCSQDEVANAARRL